MRDSIISLLQQTGLSGLGISTEQPYDESGVPLYLKNPKRIYVTQETESSEPLVQTLNSVIIQSTTTSASVFFSTDAKNTPAGYNTALSNIKGILDDIEHPGANSRSYNVRQDYSGDLLVTEVEFNFTRVT